MFHPIGSLPASVYWRRRLMLLGAAVALAGLTAWVLRPSNNAHPVAAPNAGHTSSSNAALTTTPPLSTPTLPVTSTAHSPLGSATGSAAGSVSATPGRCTPSQLKVAAAVGKPAYRIGDQPELLLQVTDVGTQPCVQDLADSQVELRVYNGESRVWGSHDCEIQPGTTDRTLLVGQPVRVSISWSGLSSEPKCAGTRQRVGAGTYTLYALLSGHTGTAAQFSVS